MNTKRKLATIRKIDEISEIPGADKIEVATVGGWKVVVQKGLYKENELAIFCEIDSWIPAPVAPFLFKGRSYNGVDGERLKTVKLKGQVSQGLLIPFSEISEIQKWNEDSWVYVGMSGTYMVNEGDDVTEMLGIQKWEKPVPGALAGVVKGNFPSFIRKTDQERVQNLKKELATWISYETIWEVTEKLDGSSMTVYINSVPEKETVDFGVCSRNFDLAGPESEYYRENSFWQVAKKLDLESKMKNVMFNFAIQGELVGPGVQGNKYGLTELDFYVFDIWDIDQQSYVPPSVRKSLVDRLGLKMAPVVGVDVVIAKTDTMENLLLIADGNSAIGNKSAREGLVYKSSCGRYSFKTISNKWLLKNDE